MLFKFAVEVCFLLLFLYSSVFLRSNLEVGQPLSEPLHVPAEAVFATILIWGFAFLARNVGKSFRHRNPLALAVLTIGLAAFQYHAILSQEVPASRLLFAYIVIGNLLGVILVQRLAASFLDFLAAPKLREVYGGLSAKLYQRRIEIWAALLFGLFWAIYIHYMGVSVGGDSFSYLLTAMQPIIGEHLQFGQFNQLPPVWPIMLSAWMFISPFTADGAAFFSSVSVFLTFVLSSLALRRVSHDSILNLAFLFLLASLQDFISMFFYGLTEPVYVLAIVATYYCIVSHLVTRKSGYFMGALVLSSLAAVTRFMGIGLSVAVVLYWIFVDGTQNSLRRVPKASLFALIAFVPFALLVWLDWMAKSGIAANNSIAIQAESGKLFVYNMGFHSVGPVVFDFLRSFWNSMAQQPYMIVSLLAVLWLLFQTKHLSQKEMSEFGATQLFSFGFIALTLLAIAFSGSVPVVRYWMPFLPFVFFAFAQAWKHFTTDARVNPASYSGALLFPLLFVLSFSIGVVRQAGWSSNMVSDSIGRSYNQPLDQSWHGFNVSSTAGGFAEFFDAISARHDRFTLLVVSGDQDGQWVLDAERGWVWMLGEFSIDNSVARPFLLKRALFSENLHDFEFVSFSEDHQILRYNLGSQRKELEMIVAAKGALDEQLREVLFASQQSGRGFFMIIYQDLFEQLAEGEREEILSRLQPVYQVDPYLIFSNK